MHVERSAALDQTIHENLPRVDHTGAAARRGLLLASLNLALESTVWVPEASASHRFPGSLAPSRADVDQSDRGHFHLLAAADATAAIKH